MTSADLRATPRPCTDLAAGAPPSSVAGEAVLAAEAAARAAGLRVRSLDTLDELAAVQRLYEQIWRPGAGAPVTTELLRALSKAGSYVGGAFDGPDLVGAAVGFFGAPAARVLHSHIAGVSARGRGAGFALKVHQRAWALLRGVAEISWTFDPLVSRNAYFNLAKLAADPVEYLPDFYGPMADGINAGDASDRLLVRWPLDAPEVAAACAGRSRAVPPEELGRASSALTATASGGPDVAPGPAGSTVLVAVPADVESMRTTDPALAASWRAALRDVLGGLLAGGARVRGFDRSGCYVLDQVLDPVTDRREGP